MSLSLLCRYWYMTCSCHRNIRILLNTFDLPESNITPSNYDEAFNRLNSTHPDTILQLDIKICNMHNFLSEVSISVVFTISLLFLILFLVTLTIPSFYFLPWTELKIWKLYTLSVFQIWIYTFIMSFII